MIIQKGVMEYLKSFPAMLLYGTTSCPPKIFLYPLKDSNGNLVYTRVPVAQDSNGAHLNIFKRMLFLSNLVKPTSNNGGPSYTENSWYFGTGSTPPAEGDYCLESGITSLSVSVANIQWYQSIDDNTIVNEYVTTFNNTSSSPLTFSEFGIGWGASNSYYANEIGTTAASSGGTKYFLLWRETLSSPVTVPSGGSFTLSIVIKEPVTGLTLPDSPRVSCGDPTLMQS